jgi:hypothetical protein
MQRGVENDVCLLQVSLRFEEVFHADTRAKYLRHQSPLGRAVHANSRVLRNPEGVWTSVDSPKTGFTAALAGFRPPDKLFPHSCLPV